MLRRSWPLASPGRHRDARDAIGHDEFVELARAGRANAG
jgi:hypothetical protein